MILDVVLIVLFLLMMLYGYKKGCIYIVAKLVSTILAFILAYFLAETVGIYIAHTEFGTNIATSVENSVLGEIATSEETTIISMIQEKLNVENETSLVKKVTDYVFTGVGFVTVFIAARIILWLARSILESIFELPVLKMFNKLGGVVASAVLFIIEISIILAAIKSLSTISFMSEAVSVIYSSVITKALYDHNIFTSLILSRII